MRARPTVYCYAGADLPPDLQQALDVAAYRISTSARNHERNAQGLAKWIRHPDPLADPEYGPWALSMNDGAEERVRRVLPELIVAHREVAGTPVLRFCGMRFLSAHEAALWCHQVFSPPFDALCQLLCLCRAESLEASRLRTLGGEARGRPERADKGRGRFAAPDGPPPPCPVEKTGDYQTFTINGVEKSRLSPGQAKSIHALIDQYPAGLTDKELSEAHGGEGTDPGRELRRLRQGDSDWHARLDRQCVTDTATRGAGRKRWVLCDRRPVK